MRNSLLNKKIPTLLGILLLLGGIIFTTIIINTRSLLQTNANPTEDPKDARITNISDSSFSVSYTTDSSVIGTVNWGESASNLNSLSLDDRDQLSQKINKYTVHEITIKSLSPDTTYFFEINSGDKQYLNNTLAYQAKTGMEISSSSSNQNPMTGKIVTSTGDAPSEALVYVKINGAQDLSALTKSDGSYTIPLNGLRDQTLSNYFPLDPSIVIAIEVFTSTSNAQASINANQISPVPAITLSNNYDFSSAQISPSPAAADSVSFPNLGNQTQSTAPQILTPDSNQEFSDQQPDFKGVAPPNSEVSITIHSNESISTTVTTSSNGTWTFRPTSKLPPGTHTITITAKNTQGILQTISRQFTVFAAGSKVDQTATPSGNITQTPTPTATLTPTPEEIAQVITPLPTTELSPAPTLPATGNSSVIMIPVFAIALFGIGIFLFLATGRKIPL